MTLFQPPEPPDELPTFGASPTVPSPYVRQQWPAEPWAQQLIPAPLPPRETWRADRVVSIVLLSLGLLGAIVGVATAILLPIGTQSVYERRGEGFFESSSSGHLLGALLWSHVLLFVAAVAVTVPLLRRRKTAFYVSLIAGAIAAVIYWAALIAYLSGDHTMRFVA